MIDSKGITFATVFKFIMELSQNQHITLFIDEFQDFFRVNSSIYSDMQNIWDSYKSTAHIHLIVAGSVNTLMNKIFKDKERTTVWEADRYNACPAFPAISSERNHV